MSRCSLTLLLCAAACSAQTLTLAEAEATAVRNHPRISAALLQALAANQVTIEARSAYYPTLFGSITGAGAIDNTRLAAGALNNPIIYNRFATGFTVSQLITDFGRTSNVVENARLRAEARQQTAQATRAEILLQVNRAYFAALRAQAVLTVAAQTVDDRQLLADQVSALATSKLKSGLDLSFAKVNLSEARLLLASARNEREAALADLSNALGYPEPHRFQLAEEPMPPELKGDLAAFLAQARRDRPELAGLRAEQSAAERLVRAERALNFPTVSTVVSGGAIPGRDSALASRYGALGLNINIPVFNGHLYGARRAEATYRARAAGQDVQDLENRIARDVQVAWLNVDTARQRLDLTAELLDQANQALELAQARYDIGLGSIVELSQAQLSKTSAEIARVGARYEYQMQRTVLEYQTGALR